MSGVSDARLLWIQGRVLLGLGVGEDEFAHMLQNGSPSPANDGSQSVSVLAAPPSAAEILGDFLGPKATIGASLFFYAEIEPVEESEEYDEEYQETEPVEDQTEVGDSIPLTGSDGSAQAPSGEGESTPAAKPSNDDSALPVGPLMTPSVLLEGAPGKDSPLKAEQQVAHDSRVITKTRTAVRTALVTKRRCRVAQGTLPDSSDRVVYFVKNVGGEVAKPLSSSDHESMILAMEYGCLAGDCLTNLSVVIKEVFAPLLDHQLGLGVLAAAVVAGNKVSADVSAVPQEAPKIGDTLRNEFRANLHKFESQVTNATQQIRGDVHLAVPNINIDDPEIGNDFEAVSLLEGAMDDWSRLIASVVEAENLKRVKGKGPMAEIEFWRRRNASLSALYEQINMPKVRSACY